jgi:hypothetical protein
MSTFDKFIEGLTHGYALRLLSVPCFWYNKLLIHQASYPVEPKKCWSKNPVS